MAVNCHSFPNMGLTFEAVARRYMAERMPTRYTTSLGYRNNLEKHAIPKWGSVCLPDMKAIDLDRWFHILPLAAKTEAHIRSVMRQVSAVSAEPVPWRYAACRSRLLRGRASCTRPAVQQPTSHPVRGTGAVTATPASSNSQQFPVSRIPKPRHRGAFSCSINRHDVRRRRSCRIRNRERHRR